MKVNELRIGNLIEYRIQDDLDDRKDWWDVSKIDATDLCILESNIDYDFRPIPLTEEWLLKLGFEKIEEYQFEISVSINCRISLINVNLESGIDVDIYTCNVNKEYGCWLNTKNKYVHQLQNLYFALTGEELVLKN